MSISRGGLDKNSCKDNRFLTVLDRKGEILRCIEKKDVKDFRVRVVFAEGKFRFCPISETLFGQIKDLPEGTTKENGICRLCKAVTKLKGSENLKCIYCLRKGSENKPLDLWICMI